MKKIDVSFVTRTGIQRFNKNRINSEEKYSTNLCKLTNWNHQMMADSAPYEGEHKYDEILHTHTHTHTHTHIYIYIYIYTNTYTHTHIYIHTHARARAHTHARARARTHAHLPTLPLYLHTRRQTERRTYRQRTRTDGQTGTGRHTHGNTHGNTHTHPHTTNTCTLLTLDTCVWLTRTTYAVDPNTFSVDGANLSITTGVPVAGLGY